MSTQEIRIYAHTSTEGMREAGRKAGMSIKAQDYFRHFDEVELIVTVDIETGRVTNAQPASYPIFQHPEYVKLWQQRDALKEEVAALKADRDEADRQAGALMRENENLKDTASKRGDWLRKAKREAGYHDSVSFDVVWDETLEKAQARDYWKGCAETNNREAIEFAQRLKATLAIDATAPWSEVLAVVGQLIYQAQSGGR